MQKRGPVIIPAKEFAALEINDYILNNNYYIVDYKDGKHEEFYIKDESEIGDIIKRIIRKKKLMKLNEIH